MNLGVPQCKNCWRWGHAIFSCRVQGSKCIKYNGPHKSENHCEFEWCCKVNEKLNLPCFETKKSELCPTCSNVPTVRRIIKPILTNAHSGGIASTENGTRRNTLKSVTTGSNQFTLQKVTSRKYDFEEPQNPFSKCPKKPSYHQYHPRDTVTLRHNPNSRTTMVYYLQSSQYFKQQGRKLCRNHLSSKLVTLCYQPHEQSNLSQSYGVH